MECAKRLLAILMTYLFKVGTVNSNRYLQQTLAIPSICINVRKSQFC